MTGLTMLGGVVSSMLSLFFIGGGLIMLFLVGLALRLFHPTQEDQSELALGDFITPGNLFGLFDIIVGVLLGCWPPVEAWIVTATICMAGALLSVVDFFLRHEEN